jgi:cell division protein FtsA
MAGFRSRQVIIGIAGELVKGFTTSVSQERKKPDQQLTARELDSLIETVQKDAMREAERTVTWETGLPNVDIRLVHAAVTGASIDGYTVTNPVGFHGRHVRISVFNAFAPLIHLGALQTVASMLGLELVAIVAEPYAVARCMDDEQVQQAGALFVDVGGGTTDVALVRQGGIEGTRMFALGGRAFTKSLADRLELPFQRAEEVKVDYAKGVAVEKKREIAEIIGEDVAVWQAGVELVLEEFARSGMLPGRIYLCGGGARLPQIGAALRDPELSKHLSFARPPQVEAIKVAQVAQVTDATGLLVDEQDITPMALAHQAVEMSAPESALDSALRRVLRQMKV